MRRRHERGLTLIEIMVSIAILGIIVLGTLAMLTSGFRLITLSNWHNKSTFNAQSAVEQALMVRNTNPAATGIVLTFGDGSTVSAPGEIRQTVETVNNAASDVWFFQPKN